MYTLDNAKKAAQENNKALFTQYISSHPLTWGDGKTYGITEQDQSEINLNLSQYQIALQAGVESPVLEWHAQKEENKPWTFEELTALSLAIAKAVYPAYHKMQQYKIAIYNCETIEEVEDIVIDY